MPLPNPLVANKLMCSPTDTLANPSIIFGTGDPLFCSGTGISGTASEINFSVGGVEVLSLDANGFVLPGDISLDELTLTSLTASRAVVSDSNKKLISSVTTLAELAFVNGVTSSIQTQLNSKLASASFTDAAVTGKLLTGYSSGAGVVAATDTILQGINKLNGNNAANSAILAGVDANAAATTLGNVVKKIEIFNSSGVSLGFIPVYDAIT